MWVSTEESGAAPAVDLMSGAFWGSPHHDELAWLRANDPVHWDGRVWGVMRHDLIKEVARQPDVFSNANGMRPDLDPLPMMTDMDDPRAPGAPLARRSGVQPPSGAGGRAGRAPRLRARSSTRSPRWADATSSPTSRRGCR